MRTFYSGGEIKNWTENEVCDKGKNNVASKARGQMALSFLWKFPNSKALNELKYLYNLFRFFEFHWTETSK